MKKLALGTMMIAGLLAACGGGDDGGIVVIDAPIGTVDADTAACNPLGAPGQQGCLTGQKCTWIQVQDTPEALGKLGCVADGTVALGGACTVGAVGETTGFDDCQAGLYCINSVCQDVCGFDNSANAACADGYSCTRYSGLFSNGDEDPVAGACKASCNPLTQMVTGGGACPNGEGCYTLTSATTTVAVCAGAGNITHGQPITGTPFANSCAPGHQPRRPGPGLNTWECGALCGPADVTSTTNMTSEGGVAPYTCESKGAAPPSNATAGESCRYYWAQEPFDHLSQYSNTIGFCFKHAIHQYDSNNDGTPDAAFPRCVNLTTGDVLPPISNPPGNDALDFWCQPKTAPFARPAPAAQLDRLAPPY